MDLQVRHCSERRARKLKIGELTVHGLNFTKKKKVLKNLIFFGREVVSKLKTTSKTHDFAYISLMDL